MSDRWAKIADVLKFTADNTGGVCPSPQTVMTMAYRFPCGHDWICFSDEAVPDECPVCRRERRAANDPVVIQKLKARTLEANMLRYLVNVMTLDQLKALGLAPTDATQAPPVKESLKLLHKSYSRYVTAHQRLNQHKSKP